MNTHGELLQLDNYLIFGAARSGLAAARLLKSLGKRVAVYDEAPAEKTTAARAILSEAGVEMLPPVPRAQLSWASLRQDAEWQALILSPGIASNHPLCELARENNCLVRSEIELGFQASPAPFAGITGTNGKTTTTHLVSHLFQNAGRVAPMAGNVGMPLCDVVRDPALNSPGALIVCELSSFQLETIGGFRPRAACVLNITPDHLDRYDSMEDYAAAKERITLNQTPEDTLVLNADDPLCMAFAERTRARVLLMSVKHPVERGAYLAGEEIFLAMEPGRAPERVMRRAEIPLAGLHNVENVLTALAMGAAMGLTAREMAAGVATFRAVPHRIEWIARVDGADYYNDSKATNLDSVEKALESFDRPIVLIAGGRDKGAPWTRLNDLVRARVKGLVLIGEAAPIGLAAWGGIVPRVETGSDMADAVRRCRAMVAPGEVVLLSPACASFDMYRNYEERGDHFRSLVLDLTKTS